MPGKIEIWRRRRFGVLSNRRPSAPPGQTLVEFALVLPVLTMVMVGIVQFGLLFWTQITLTQVARDTGRWAATQTTCSAATVNVQSQADAIAANSSLFGYTAGALVATPKWGPPPTNAASCPPPDNTDVKWIDIHFDYTTPVFLPFFADTCSPSCQRVLTTDVQYRVEALP